MKCLTDDLQWFDWALMALLYVLGIWKANNLIDKHVPVFVHWLAGKISGSPDETDKPSTSK